MPDRPDATLDASGLLCPQPVLRARRALKPLAVGAVLEIVVTDPAAPDDLAAFARRGGHALIARERHGERARLWLRKGAAPAERS